MDLTVLINQILVLFIIILLGFVLRKRNLITEDLKKGLSSILIQVTMPVLIIDSILKINLDQKLIKRLTLVTLIAILVYLFLIIISILLTSKMKCSRDKKNIFIFLLVFANVGYMGIPIVSSILPPEAVIYTIIYNIVYNIYVWTFGVQLFSHDKNIKKNIQWRKLINQGTIALILGFFLLLTNIPLGPVRGAIKIVAEMTFPLSMLIIGSYLTEIKGIHILKDKYLYYQLILKLIIIPLAGFFILKLLKLPEMVVIVSAIMLAMPSGANGVIFAEKYNSDAIFASEAVFLTTLFSLFTIPLIIWIIGNI